MYKKAWCTRKVVDLRLKPIVCLMFSLSSASLDLKDPKTRKERTQSLMQTAKKLSHFDSAGEVNVVTADHT